MPSVTSSPPRAPPIKYTAPLGTRWAKETAAAGGVGAFDLPTDPKNIGPWILGECVGKGASGRVKIAKHRHTGQLAAVKILPIAPLVSSRASLATQQAKSEKQRLGIDREITMMKLMNHPNIMRIYDVFEGDKELFLVLEYVEGGELFDFLVNRGRLPPGEALAYFKQIVYGLNYAHTFSIIHRDLKPENILIASISPPLIKIADWGMAAFAPPSLQLETSCGSPHYASPEIVNGEKYQGNATDIWSCGVILYALLTGRLPFDDKNVRTLLGKVKSGKYDMPSWIDPLAKDLLGRMLVVDVKKRITVPDILSHPWLYTSTVASASSPDDANKSAMLVPQLPPSPSTLARPIASPSHIDAELLSSLRVIWGRHTDPHGESIKRDLCAPAGRGVHAKAFYFLLGRYREESLRNSLEGSGRPEKQSETNTGIGSVKFNLGWELDLSTVTKKYDGNRSSMLSLAPPPYSRTPSPASMPIPGLVPPSMYRGGTSASGGGSSRERAASPAGPRAPPPHMTGRTRSELWRAQSRALDDTTLSSSGASTRPQFTSSGIGRGGPRPPPSRRGHTYNSSRAPGQVSSIQFPQHLQGNNVVEQERPKSAADHRPSLGGKRTSMFVPPRGPSPERLDPSTTATTASAAVPATIIHAPVPISASRRILGMNMDIANDLPLLTAPKASNAELQKTMDEVAERVNGFILQASAVPLLDTAPVLDATPYHAHAGGQHSSPTQREPAHVHGHRAFPRVRDMDDKENRPAGDEEWGYVCSEDGKNSGVGLGMGRDLGRNIENVENVENVAHHDAGLKGKKGKGRKGRPSTLDFHALSQKRSTLSALGSPITLHAPINAPLNPNRLLTSPVVGEFRGWFSNLFNWKNQSNGHGGILYSSDDVSKTRAEVGGLLEALGVNVEGGGFGRGMSQGDCGGPLKCRVEEQNGETSNLKLVRFRVEFSSAPDPGQSPISPNSTSCALTTPAANPQFLTTPTLGSTPRVRTSMLMNRGSHGTLMPGPCAEFPPGRVSAIFLIHEKGSLSSFRTVWRRLKEVYGDGSAAYPSWSPAMASTPLEEHAQRFAL